MRYVRLPLLGLLVLAAMALQAGNAPPASAFTAMSVDAGGGHSCAVTPPGGLKCWGATATARWGMERIPTGRHR